jgi:adenylate cyclase
MNFVYSYKNKDRSKSFEGQQVLIGRQQGGNRVDLDLSPDVLVSRRHARIWLDAGFYWIEDLNSAGGTRLNGSEIRGKGRQHLHQGDTIEIGETILRLLDALAPGSAKKQMPATPPQPPPPPPSRPLHSLDADRPSLLYSATATTEAERQLALFYSLPLKFGAEADVNSLLQVIVESAVDAIPTAQRGALLIEDSTTGQLALRAHTPIGSGAASKTLARQAINQLQAVVWPSTDSTTQALENSQESATQSISEYRIAAAMYAPLLWRGTPLGALCVDTSDARASFHEEDLQLLQAIAHHGAMALSNLQLQDEQWRLAKVQNRLLKLVSPQISDRLVHYQGHLKLGGEFRNVTILISDIRGFTNLSKTMSPDEVSEMLEDYYHRLVPLVFKYHGTIDKFVGDAILAVYGSPADDKLQHLHAVLTAMEMQSAMREVNAKRSAQGKRTGKLGIGINCGEVIHGLIGSAERMEFTVIGDAVNLASRFCDGADGGEVLISPKVHSMVWDMVEVEERQIATKHEGKLRAYRIKRLKLGKMSEPPADG